MQRAYSLLIIVLFLVQSSIGQRKDYTVNYQKCNKELFESFRQEQNPKEYHFTVEEALSGVDVLSVQKCFVDYQVVLASDNGMRPITGFAILVDSHGSCQQPAGWFDQLDSLWNVTQCVNAQYTLLQVGTYPKHKIKLIWTTSLNCNTTFQYNVIKSTHVKQGIHKRSTGAFFDATQKLPLYILLAQRRSLYQLSLDGTRKRTVVSNSFSDILAMDYHYRMGHLYWSDQIDTNNYRIMRSNIDGSQPTTIMLSHQLNPTTQTCTTSGALRLVGGSATYEGRVEICFNNTWGTICGNHWDTNDAVVVCRQLGFVSLDAGPSGVSHNASFGHGIGPIWLGDVACIGNESRLTDCHTNPVGVHNCSASHDVARVNCRPLTCNTSGALRLVGGPTPYEGCVEICMNNVWGTVCDDQWSDADAMVVCRQLMLNSNGAGVVVNNASFGYGTGPIWLDNVDCSGIESKLINCQAINTYDYENHDCDHQEDVGVRCLTVQTCTTSGALRLVGGSAIHEGRVEVCINNTWGTVCDDDWDTNDAVVVCRQLMLPSSGAEVASFASFGVGIGQIWLDNVACTGNESRLIDCPANPLGNHNCHHVEDAGVRCLPLIVAGQSCTTTGAVRLVGGSTIYEGRVEICISNIWGTVCDDRWDISDAVVVCRQLGFKSHGAIALDNASFGAGTGQIWLDDVACNNHKSWLMDCSANLIGSHDCDHSEDAGVKCIAMTTTCNTTGALRLVGGSNTYEGRVEVCFNNTWGTVCDDGWTTTTALVVCSQLGLDSTVRSSIRFGTGSGRIWLDNLACTGREKRLIDCPANPLGNHDCQHHEDAGVRCRSPTSEARRCDMGALRLVGGSTPYEGRVEVCINNLWGTVCDDRWSDTDAVVVCRQLQHVSSPASAEAVLFASFGVGVGQIWLDNVACTGNESKLIDCPANPPGLHNCHHVEDAGVRCLHQVAITGLAVDWVSHKLYYVERRVWDQYNTIGVLDITTSIYKVLPLDVEAPYNIIVDPTNRWLYWSDSGHNSIEKASMDGKNQTTIIAFNSSYYTHVTFTMDYQTQILYWVDSYSNTLETSNVDGANRQILLISSDIKFYHGVSLFRDILLLSGSYGKVYTASTTGQNFQLVTASLNCVSSVYQPPILRVISQERQPKNYTNPCGTTNGGCSHFCLLSAMDPRGYSCDCPKGMMLDGDKQSCTGTATNNNNIQDSGSCQAAGYADHCCVSGTCLGSPPNCRCDASCYSFDDCCTDVPLDCDELAIEECCGILITNQNQIFRVDTSPTYRLQTLLSNLKHAFSLDFHYRSNHLFWTAIHNSSVFIWRSNLNDGSDAIPLIDTETRENQFNIDIAVDWITDKIYWTVNSCIMVHDLQSGYQTTVINYTRSAFFYQVEVDPNTSTLYWSYRIDNIHFIAKASMDGNSNTTILYHAFSYHHLAFTLDYVKHVLYWTIYESCSLKSSSSVDGSNKRDYSRDDQVYCYTLAIDFFKGTIYSYSIHHKQIAKTVLPSENRSLTVSYYNYISNHMCSSYPLYRQLKVVSYRRQKPGFNPCAINNGGCAHLCLLSSNNSRNYTCACHNGAQLHQDGHDCIVSTGSSMIITSPIPGSCSAAGYNMCCASGPCKGESPISNCYCDKLCHIFKDCCPDANALCQKDTTAGSTVFTATIRPQNLTISLSKRAKFHCSLHSLTMLKPNFTWNFTRKGTSTAQTIANKSVPLSTDYIIIPGQKSETILITNVQWRHDGVYTCIMSSENRQIQAEATLNVHIPLNNLVIRGSSSSPVRLDVVTVECNVTANPPASIMWMKKTNGRMQALINTLQTSITYWLTYTPSGPVSTSTLTISNVEADDNGEYICKANNGPSSPSISANFTVCIVAQGSVIVTPLDPWANQFGKAELNCSVCPTLTPLFMWNFTQRGGCDTETVANRSQPLSSKYTITMGQKSQTLIINNAQWSDVGVYKCMTSINGTLIEAETSLDVHIQLSNLSIRGDNDNPKELDTVTIECDVIANPPANITWLKQTSERVRILTSNSKTFITHQLTDTSSGPLSRSTLTVRNVEENDSGDYICEARNNQSSSESTNFNFTIITQNECLIDNFGSSPCQNYGVCVDHIYSYTCYCNGRYTGVNCSEEVLSDKVERPIISQPPENTVILLGDPIHLNCTAEGHPAPTYKWYKDGVLIPNKIESVLYIQEPSPKDRGNYTCKAINSEGETDESKPAKLDIADVVQYQAKLNVSEIDVKMIIKSIAMAILPNSSASIFEVKQLSVNISSKEATILITVIVRQHDIITFESSVVQRQLRSALLQILQDQAVVISRFDGCNFTTAPFDIGSNITTEIEWPETNLGDTASVPCPCTEFAGSLAGRAYRYCSGTFSQGAHWEALDVGKCEALNQITTRRLCEAALLLATNPTRASEAAVEETLTPESLTAAQVSISITIVANLTNEVLNNSEIRQNYLQAIDNIQQAPADVVLQSEAQTSSSSRLLESLQDFLDKVEVEPDDNSTTNSSQTVFAFETFALQLQQLDTEEYKGQMFSVNLGLLEVARENNQTIDKRSLVTSKLESATKFNKHELNMNAMASTTASLLLPEDLLESCNDVNSNLTSAIPQRLSYSVFKSDVLFQNLNQSHLSIGSIIVAARLKCADNVTLNTSIQPILQIDRMVEERSIGSACAMWDKGNSEDRFGAWSTEGCREVVREGNWRVCECSQLAHFGILFDLSPKAPVSNEAAIALSVITYIGLIISLLCLTVFVISYLSAKKLRTSIHGQILINLSLALIGVYTFFLIGGHVTSVPVLCGISSSLLHYFLLVFFGWTAVEAVWLYLKLVKVFGIQSVASKFTLKAGIPTWVVPLIVVIVCAGAASKYYINPFYCRATEWPFWLGMILPFSLVTVFNWIMFILIMVSICSHTQSPVNNKKEGSKIRVMKTNFTIAATLAIVFGLGWALGLTATSLPVKELTLTFQILFSIFVGAQGILLFLLHGVRNQDIRKVWIQFFATIGRKSHLASIMSSTKTSSGGPESLRDTRNTSGVSTLPHKKDEYASTLENMYSKRPYQNSMGGSVAMEMVPASKGYWDQSVGGLQQVSYVDSDEEHIYDDIINVH